MSAALALPRPTGRPPGKPPPVDVDGILATLGLSARGLARQLDTTPVAIRRWRVGDGPAPTRAGQLRWLLERAGKDPLPFLGDRLAEAIPPEGAMPDTTRLRLVQPGESAPTHEETEPMRSRTYLDDPTLKHFGLASDPFADPETPEEIWFSPALRQIEKRFLAAIRDRQIVVLVGSPGAGKSTLLRRLHGLLLSQTSARLLCPATVDRRKLTAAALGQAIVRDLTGKSTASLSAEARGELLRRALTDAQEQNQRPVLVIDEGHHLTPSALLAIKQLWDSNLMYRQLGILLVGQHPLRELLEQDVTVREVTERSVVLALPDLGASTADYLRWRWTRAGGNDEATFEKGAYAALASKAATPLSLNNLVTAVLCYTAEQGDTQVTAAHVGRV